MNCIKCDCRADWSIKGLDCTASPKFVCRVHIVEELDLVWRGINVELTITALTKPLYRVCTVCGRKIEWSTVAVEDSDELEEICMPCSNNEGKRFRPAQIGEWERPVVWEDPTDPNPETRYRYPAGYDASSNAAMPDYYKKLGFQKKEFATLRDHEKFQRETNTRNYKTWDIKRH